MEPVARPLAARREAPYNRQRPSRVRTTSLTSLYCRGQPSAATTMSCLVLLGGQERVEERIGGPLAIRHSHSNMVKDEEYIPRAEWERTKSILPQGALVAGYLTGRFDV